MSKAAYSIYSILILLIVLIFPLYQLIYEGGLLYYTNGWDEASYLQYDYARHIIDISKGGRFSEYLIIFLHEAGFSGGWINFIFDFFFTAAFLFLLPKFFNKLKFTPENSRVISISLLGLPLIFSNLNPLYDNLQKFVMDSSAIQWISMPYIKDPFWLRTPEPQLSLIIILCAALLSLKYKNILFLFPFLIAIYPFLLLPVLFISLSIFSCKYFKFSERKSFIISALSISIMLLIYKNYFLPDEIAGYIIPGNRPLISYCGLLAWLFFVFSQKRQEKLSSILILSIWFALNFQIISGFTIQPNNFEQYWGAGALSLIILLQFSDTKLFRIFPLISIILLLIWGIKNFSINMDFLNRKKLSNDFLSQIKNDASKAALPDIQLSTRLDMLFPKQKPLLFSYTRFYKKLPEYHLNDFLCAKEFLKSDPDFQPVLKEAEEFYKNGDKNYIMNTIGRVIHSVPDRDFSKHVKACGVTKAERQLSD